MNTPKAYKIRSKKLSGTDYLEVRKKVSAFYSRIEKRTKRRTYVRSAYFDKDKVFLGLFWHHLKDRLNFKDKIRRLKYFPCAIDLIEHSKFAPSSKINTDRRYETLHRFAGITADNEIFFVQIKENKNNGQKYLISVFPLG